jgi:hypothetical protein
MSGHCDGQVAGVLYFSSFALGNYRLGMQHDHRCHHHLQLRFIRLCLCVNAMVFERNGVGTSIQSKI